MVRYPRGSPNIGKENGKIELGKGIVCFKGKEVAILNFGALIDIGRIIAQFEGYTLVDMRFVKPIDEKLLEMLSLNHKLFVTLEENTVVGGAGSAVLEAVSSKNLRVETLVIGVPDKFIEQDDPKSMRKAVKLTTDEVTSSVKKKLMQISSSD